MTTHMPLPFAEPHASWRSWTLLAVCWGCMALTLVPVEALAQAIGVAPVPEMAAAFSLWEIVKQGGSLGVAAVCGWWALRKDKEAKEAADARVEDAKANAERRVLEAREADARAMAQATKRGDEMIHMMENMTAATMKMEAAVDRLTHAVEAFQVKG